MLVLENQCVDCGKPCLFEGCPYYSVPVYYCDSQDGKKADYRIDGEHYCKDCAKRIMQELFDDNSIEEQAWMLELDITAIEDLV